MAGGLRRSKARLIVGSALDRKKFTKGQTEDRGLTKKRVGTFSFGRWDD